MPTCMHCTHISKSNMCNMKRIRPTGDDGIEPNNNNNNDCPRESNNSNESSTAMMCVNRTANTCSSGGPPLEHDGSDSVTSSSMGIPESQVDDAQAQVLRQRGAPGDNSDGSSRSLGANSSGGGNTSTSPRSTWPPAPSTALEASEQNGGGRKSPGGSASGENDLGISASSACAEAAAADGNDEVMENAGADVGGGAVGGTHQLNVFVLVRLLFHYLEKVDPQLLLEAKRALKDCDRRKREGDPGYQQLSEVVPRRLRRIVGTKHWGRALEIQRNYLLQKQRKKKQRDDMIQHRRQISRNRDKKGTSVNPNVVSMESSVNTTATGLAPASSAAASASSASGSASSSAQQQQCDTGSSNFSSSSPSPSVYNPGLLHRVVVPSGVGESSNNNQTHILSPFEVAQRALAAQVEAYNQASAQMGLTSVPQMQQQQDQQQAFGFPPAPEAQSLRTSVATDAWQGRMAMSACNTTDDSSESSSSKSK